MTFLQVRINFVREKKKKKRVTTNCLVNIETRETKNIKQAKILATTPTPSKFTHVLKKQKIVSCTDHLRYSSVNIKVLNDFLETNLDPLESK